MVKTTLLETNCSGHKRRVLREMTKVEEEKMKHHYPDCTPAFVASTSQPVQQEHAAWVAPFVVRLKMSDTVPVDVSEKYVSAAETQSRKT